VPVATIIHACLCKSNVRAFDNVHNVDRWSISRLFQCTRKSVSCLTRQQQSDTLRLRPIEATIYCCPFAKDILGEFVSVCVNARYNLHLHAEDLHATQKMYANRFNWWTLQANAHRHRQITHSSTSCVMHSGDKIQTAICARAFITFLFNR